ncbi:thermonuclease family protein [Erythrobacter arachoides]|uniref:Thermonuclease family protein n=1 Tax=Aurantiacibacter arachoides TaxID=1850444 RepID=A0A845A483_9SPHN|nr:thermonuclease family protein [Aurantiacibacter arachoides]MXO94232.1 thermonuclease family protein [Aurantiacibacter arachoides]GGD65116.1 hypothetical protein GCM10011411_26770 [Aurantiacibacter arachoides]
MKQPSYDKDQLHSLDRARQRRRKKQGVRSLGLAAVAFIGTFVGGFILTSDSSANQQPATQLAALSVLPENSAMPICDGPMRVTCVVDGDTFWLEGEKIRIADIDTPEVSQPQCEGEAELGRRATVRLAELLNAGAFELQSIGERDRDQYGRLLRVITRDGQSLGDQLVREGLARTWTGRRQPWC